jgi:hypothetical protein
MTVDEERLSPLDAAFLELEQANEGAVMSTGGALIFDPRADGGGTPSLEQVVALLDERFGLLPRFRSRLSEPRVHGLRVRAGSRIRASICAPMSAIRRCRLPAGKRRCTSGSATSGRTGSTAPGRCGR